MRRFLIPSPSCERLQIRGERAQPRAFEPSEDAIAIARPTFGDEHLSGRPVERKDGSASVAVTTAEPPSRGLIPPLAVLSARCTVHLVLVPDCEAPSLRDLGAHNYRR